jgi:hypothetical protein
MAAQDPRRKIDLAGRGPARGAKRASLARDNPQDGERVELTPSGRPELPSLWISAQVKLNLRFECKPCNTFVILF